MHGPDYTVTENIHYLRGLPNAMHQLKILKPERDPFVGTTLAGLIADVDEALKRAQANSPPLAKDVDYLRGEVFLLQEGLKIWSARLSAPSSAGLI